MTRPGQKMAGGVTLSGGDNGLVMIALPILTHLAVANYAMFPGKPDGTGLEKAIPAGLTLVAGINGLGKTTLLTAILRLLTGPFDMTGVGLGQLGGSLPAQPVRLIPQALQFFAQRVEDAGRSATATIEVKFGQKRLRVVRSLQHLQLLSASIDGDSIISGQNNQAESENAYQARVCELMGLSSFVDVLLVLHYVIFFPEDRSGALWDPNAQRQLLRALFVPAPTAAAIARGERDVGSADSMARNLSAVLFQQKRTLENARQAQAAEPGVRARLKSQQALLNACVERRSVLDQEREAVQTELDAVRLDYERAKIEREDADRAVERLKFETIDRMFPTMADSARLTILTLLSKSECLVCGAQAELARKQFEVDLGHGICPVCHSPPEAQENVVAPHAVEASRLARVRKRAASAGKEEVAQAERLSALTERYSSILGELKSISSEMSELQAAVGNLNALLPAPTKEIQRLEQQVEGMEEALRAANARRAELAEELRAAQRPVQAAVKAKSATLVSTFERHARALLADEATLVRDEARATIAQQSEQFVISAFFAEMASASRPGLTRRRSPTDVSESQRELIDLAFRFALIEAAGCSGTSTLVMETPEASLDEIAMERVGRALAAYAAVGENRLVATSNLTNAGMISWLFGGRTRSRKDLAARQHRLVNLLEIAAQNRALELDTSGRYQQLLERALKG